MVKTDFSERRRLTNMENRELVDLMEKVEDWQIKFTCLSADQLLAHVVTMFVTSP